jgi:hypothetical protein
MVRRDTAAIAALMKRATGPNPIQASADIVTLTGWLLLRCIPRADGALNRWTWGPSDLEDYGSLVTLTHTATPFCTGRNKFRNGLGAPTMDGNACLNYGLRLCVLR